MKYRSIVLSGPVAAGTSTAAKVLSEKLNLPVKSPGDFFRKFMQEHNIPLPNKEEIPDDVDRKIDEETTDMIEKSPGVIVDSLYAGYFTRNMPQVLRVLLKADEEERIRRALSRTHTHKETAGDVRQRDRAHDLKFRKLYADENFLDPKFFDLVIDTTNTKAEEVIKKITKKFLRDYQPAR